jgi:lactate dehydrogenase-like 2-hydroxyacid dehydrogenase
VTGPGRATSGSVYVTRLLTDDAMAALAALGPPLVTGREEPPTRAELLRDAEGAHAVVSTLTDRVDAAVMDAAGPGLRIVANVAVGYDNVDVAAARERGVVVTNTPGVLDAATADLTMGLVLAPLAGSPRATASCAPGRRGSGGRG